jgi:hypothetical protein
VHAFLIAAVALLATTSSGHAAIGDNVDVHPWSGAQYVQHCTSKVDERYFACQMFTRGVADGIIISNKIASEQYICIPTRTLTRLLIDVAVDFIRLNAQDRH